jgi:hypothetical protein
MSSGNDPKPAKLVEVAFRNGQRATESLPLPIVLYPGHYGTFFAFASSDNPERFFMCSCAEPAIRNFLALKEEHPPNSDPNRMALLDSHHFPLNIASRSLQVEDAWSVLEFTPRICHRCNLVRPSMNYCHPMYGGQFIQGFGWYVNQVFYRNGVSPRTHRVLDEVCPGELLRLIERKREVVAEYQRESDRLNVLLNGPDREDIAPDEVTYWHNVKLEEAEDYKRLRRLAAQATRAVTTFIENIVRKEFGFRKVGEGWVSETLLSQLVCRVLPDREVVRHYRPEWLKGLELDIWVPELSLGVEYQGQQHFHAIEAWGGKAALARLRKNDAKKLELCRQAGITLLTVDYTEPLTEEHVSSLLARSTQRAGALRDRGDVGLTDEAPDGVDELRVRKR